MWSSQPEVKDLGLEVTSKMPQSSGLPEQMEKRRPGLEGVVEGRGVCGGGKTC